MQFLDSVRHFLYDTQFEPLLTVLFGVLLILASKVIGRLSLPSADATSPRDLLTESHSETRLGPLSEFKMPMPPPAPIEPLGQVQSDVR